MPLQTSESFRTGRYVAGLNSLRFVCAVWVALHHGARPAVAAWLGFTGVGQDWNAIMFDGPAAVIVFFVISGLCVHYPYTRSEPCSLPTFYAQRYVRIGLPLLVVWAFLKLAGGVVGADVAEASRVVLWSLWCELIYYGIYPALLIGFRRIGFAAMIAISFVAASLVIISHWQLMTYWDYPVALAWITALPAWLLGCAIAQMLAARRMPVLPGSIWAWRAAALFLSIPPKALVYASVTSDKIGNPATLGVFAVFVFFWVMKEISTFERRPPPALLEWAGRWSYSLYLIHNVVLVALTHVDGSFGHFSRWPLKLAAILTVAYAFYLAVERPAHRLARLLGQRLAVRQVMAVSLIPRSPVLHP
jgi:peptidoglycan/LPS O-acetylase OafA/YrhL